MLVVLVGEFADAVLELEVAQVFVDSGFALIQMLKGGNRLGNGQIFGPYAQDESDHPDGDQSGYDDNHLFQVRHTLFDLIAILG